MSRPTFVFGALGLLASVFAGSSGCSHNRAVSPPAIPLVMSKSGPITEADLGIPIYPRASALENKSFVYHANPRAAAPSSVSVTMTTPDSVDQVESFYREKIGRQARFSLYDTAGGKLVHMDLTKGNHEIHLEILPLSKGTGSVFVILSQYRPASLP